MCGIIGICQRGKGVIGEPLGSFLKKSLHRLEYRGYDSVGFAVIDQEGGIFIRKKKGKLADVESVLGFDSFDGIVGIAHTRWATHGEPSDRNAHPHIDCIGCVSVVHNGTLQNYQELKEFLISRGHLLRSDTDTELIAHLLEEKLGEGVEPLEALRAVIRSIKGTYAFLAYICKDQGKIYFAKNISPMVIGVGENFNIIASDIPAILSHTKKAIVIEDGEIGYISPTNIYIEKLSGDTVDPSSRIAIIDWTPDMVDKSGYPHYMLKEIYEQPIAMYSTLSGLPDQVNADLQKMLLNARRIYITGAGTSYHASMAIEYAFRNILDLDARAFIASEYQSILRGLDDRDVLVAISQSGETIDTLVALRRARMLGAKVISITNVVGSAVSREADYRIYMRAGPEIGVAATKTFASEIIAGMYIVEKLCPYRGVSCSLLAEEIRSSPEYVKIVIEKYHRELEALSKILRSTNNMYFLGRGSTVPVSYEGALKVKEISYIHAEAYPAGESKHGPIALVEPGFPVVFTIFDDEYSEPIINNIEEMRARGAYTIVVASENLSRHLKLAGKPIPMPIMKTPAASAVYVVIHQLLAYNLAVSRGFDPDKPRNLAKTVTVE
ncbi:MAG: glutamine--fructose-6-phosphate transaminase (isomerizing) [Desulfurococcales archaeon]|nr:glutamine--fructose-6-phosphate transaminase (isomerizing) [Desulfurococcales archaeon]